jgi:casein kinase II subunit beta
VFDSAEDAEFGWINYFLTLKGNEFFCQVDEDYIHDNFNLTGLANQVPYYDFALDLITDIDNDEDFSDEHQEMIEHDAEVLYGLVHARFIITNRGLQSMLDKYRHHEFGSCPRVLCNNQALLPVGLTDQKSKESVKLFCPKCQELYKPKSSRHENVDGAYFGTTFPHLFFLVFPELKPEVTIEKYIPKVFGFRLHKTSQRRSIEAARRAMNNRKNKQAYSRRRSGQVKTK